MKRLYSIHDTSAGYFLPPFMALNDAQASRMFIGSLGDSFSFRQDFNLYHIADFDDESGVLATVDSSIVLRGNSIAPTLDPRVQRETQEAAE